jgi:hypothetical protein
VAFTDGVPCVSTLTVTRRLIGLPNILAALIR